MSRRATLGGAFAIGLLLAQMLVLRAGGSEAAARLILPFTVGLVPLALWPHRRYLGVWVLYVGLAANLLPIVANGGLMPIERSTVVDAVGAERAEEYAIGQWIRGSKDVLVEDNGRLLALGDQIIIRVGDAGMAASPGDVVVGAGILIIALEASLAWNRRHTAREPQITERARDRARGGAAT
jgi:hypothetical protein